MRVPNSGDRKLTELDFIRLKKFIAAGTFPQLAAPWAGRASAQTVDQIEGILFQPEPTGDYLT